VKEKKLAKVFYADLSVEAEFKAPFPLKVRLKGGL